MGVLVQDDRCNKNFTVKTMEKISEIKTVKDFELKDKKVLLRVDFDTPLDKHGRVKDDKRIRICIPTINYILNQNPEKLILLWKLNRPKNKEERLKTDNTAKKAGEILGRKIVKVNNWGENGLPENKIVALENLRFNKGEQGNEKEKNKFAEQLACLGDIYINDAFAMAHRKDASVYNIVNFIQSGIGLNFEREIKSIKGIIETPERPYIVILGGAKTGKINSIENLVNKTDKILIGGVPANTFLKSKDYEIEKSKFLEEKIELCKNLLSKYENKLILPEDVRVSINDKVKNVDIRKIPRENEIMDIGDKTVENYKKYLEKSKTVYWVGPLGVFENKGFENGTKEIGEFLAFGNKKVLVGGGDTSSALDKFELEGKMSFVSSSGGASLRLVEGKSLPVLEILKNG